MISTYIPELDRGSEKYEISGEEFHHLKNVLRIKREEKLTGFNGKDLYAELKIEKIEKNKIVVKAKNFHEFKKDYSISVAIPFIKHKNFNFTLKSIQQLGVKKIFPYISERSVTKRVEKEKIEKWNKILIESAKQSRNYYIPFIENIYTIENLLEEKDFKYKFVFYEKGENRIKTVEKGDILMITGPEGGFSEREIEILKNNGFVDIKLKGNILRSEIATITTLSILKFLIGEL